MTSSKHEIEQGSVSDHDIGWEFGRTSSIDPDSERTNALGALSSGSATSLFDLGQLGDKQAKTLMMDILTTPNDLAGFCLIWIIGLFYVIILRASGHKYVVDAAWFSIITIPCIVCVFTWLFAYLISKYTNRTEQESLRVPIFYIPFLCKVLVAMIFFSRLMAEMKHRYGENPEYSLLCDASLTYVWFNCVLSMATAEILITTVQVNSINNIDQYRLRQEKKSWLINVFLFVTRPILWVYNRLIVMFISFYCYYYLLFAVGPVTTYICPIADIRSLRDIGVSTLLLPFHNVLYLFEFEAWTQLHLDHYEDHTDAMFAVIQQVLVFTTASDLILDIWSLYWLWKERARAIYREDIESGKRQPTPPPEEPVPVIEEEKHTVQGYVDDGFSYCLEPPLSEETKGDVYCLEPTFTAKPETN
eukprot:279952_1